PRDRGAPRRHRPRTRPAAAGRPRAPGAGRDRGGRGGARAHEIGVDVSHFEREINEQPDALERLLRSGAAREAAVALQADPPALIATVARGSSNNAVAFFSHLAGRYLRLPVANLPL